MKLKMMTLFMAIGIMCLSMTGCLPENSFQNTSAQSTNAASAATSIYIAARTATVANDKETVENRINNLKGTDEYVSIKGNIIGNVNWDNVLIYFSDNSYSEVCAVYYLSSNGGIYVYPKDFGNELNGLTTYSKLSDIPAPTDEAVAIDLS